MPSIAIGTAGEIASQLCQLRERYGFSYFIVADQHLDRFAPIVDELTGK